MSNVDRDCFSKQFARKLIATVPQPKGDELVRRRMPTEIASEQHISVEELDQLREKRFAMRDTPYEQQGSLDDLHGVFGKIDEE